MNDIEIGVIVAIIIAVCEAVKYAGLKTRYIPLIAIALGIGGAVYVGGINWMQVLYGILTAFIASGMFSTFKKTVLNK